jgi:hypothetical protein
MKQCHWLCVFFCFVLLTQMLFSNAHGNQLDSVIKDIEDIISQGESASFAKFETVRIKIEENPERILPQLLLKANNPQIAESNLAVYLWAIGLTKSPKAIDDIIKLSSGKKSESVIGNAYKALATIGGDAAGKYLFRQLNQTSDQMMRYNLLDLLAQIQYRQALPKTIDILKQDPNQFYWQTIFVFGKYGDIAVPFLLEKIVDKDQNIRTNAIMALGQWLIPTESLKPLKNQFWQESSPQVRGLILSSLEKINPNLSDIHSFSQEVIKKETDENVKRFAQETIDNSEKIKNHVEDFKTKKKEDSVVFNAEYNKIINSFGKKGDYDKLSVASSKGDEVKLKKLRETILQRNSDECFYDYQKVNHIIILNRLM